MPYSDLLRVTVLLTAGEATVLAMIGVLGAERQNDTTTMAVGGAWWLVAIAIGGLLGRDRRAAEGVRGVLAEARTSTSLPSESPARIATLRLWPIAATALIAGGIGLLLPAVATIGSGFALLVAVAWRGREAAVLAVEQRDGARFYVLPGSAFTPLKLMRAPGLTSDAAYRA